MGFFDLGSKEDEIAEPSSKKNKTVEAEEKPANVKQTEVRKMSGYSDIRDVARDAPENFTDTPRGKQTSSKRISASERKAIEEERERAEKKERQKRALQTFGRRLCKTAAELPFDMWSQFAGYEFLKLSPEESLQITEMYFEYLEAIEPDLTNPWVILGTAVFVQAVFAGQRLKKLKEIEQAQKDKDEEIAKEAEDATKTNVN